MVNFVVCFKHMDLNLKPNIIRRIKSIETNTLYEELFVFRPRNRIAKT